MNNQDFLIKLIQQDLKHHQLTLGLDKIGLEGSEKHNLRILELVAELMQVPKETKEKWSNTYLLCMEEAVNYKITERGEELKPLAEESYRRLSNHLE